MTIDKQKIRAAAMAAANGDSAYFEWMVTPPTVLELLDALDKAEKDRAELLDVVSSTYSMIVEHDDLFPFDFAVICEMLHASMEQMKVGN